MLECLRILLAFVRWQGLGTVRFVTLGSLRRLRLGLVHDVTWQDALRIDCGVSFACSERIFRLHSLVRHLERLPGVSFSLTLLTVRALLC